MNVQKYLKSVLNKMRYRLSKLKVIISILRSAMSRSITWEVDTLLFSHYWVDSSTSSQKSRCSLLFCSFSRMDHELIKNRFWCRQNFHHNIFEDAPKQKSAAPPLLIFDVRNFGGAQMGRRACSVLKATANGRLEEIDLHRQSRLCKKRILN